MPTIKVQSMSRRAALELIAPDLAGVEKAIGAETLCSVESVTAIGHHLQMSGGKRLRPALLLLAAGLCDAKGDSAVKLGAVMEVIHTATLMHDDVIDNAEVRRGRPSTNQRWGNQTSVLAGDWLYMQAFRLALQERNFDVLDQLIDLTQRMVEGELMQAEWVGRIDVSEQEHLDLVSRKTACFFSVCTRLGGVLGKVSPEREQLLADFGCNIGTAFQLIDDVLDFTATEDVLGKPVGNDLGEGKVTLPLILALERCRPAQRKLVETVIEERSYESVRLGEILALLEEYDTINEVRGRALAYAAKAEEQLSEFPDSVYKRALFAVTDWVVDRES